MKFTLKLKIMKRLLILIFFVVVTFFSCKKQAANNSNNAAVNSSFIFFEILDKNGNNVIHSVTDSLVVTYQLNGVTQINRLDIFKAQTSATSNTLISNYDGFVISDANTNILGKQGYMSAASGGAIQYNPITLGVRNFNLYLNVSSLGTIYLDYWAAIASSNDVTNFTLNNTPTILTNMPSCFLVPGYPSVLTYNFLSEHNGTFANGFPIYVLHWNGVLTN